ncbi:ribulose-phosphate 3-epimerase [Hungatella sp.]|uniref:ribulose-phosphate 3-epimerase n=1 Tax=Hungatella sp. TaxID=2613924 RepID=UPI002A7F6CDA|nr:ribulose-phosphate 3-epimerase [Hungatella sp.]
MKLMPSIASADPLAVGEVLKNLEAWPYLHIDIEDGNFVPNITFGMKTVRAICKEAGKRYIQVHLMVSHPETYLDGLAACGVDSVIAHLEALDYPLYFLNHCRALGLETGLAVNIKTPVEAVNPFLDNMDQLLLMTSEPDYLEEKVYGPAVERLIRLAGTIPAGVELYADGGVTRETLRELERAGVHGAVLGRLVFQSPDPLEMLKELKEE